MEVVSIVVSLTAQNDAENEDNNDNDDASSFLDILEAIEQQVQQTTGNGQSFNTTAPNIAIVTTNVVPNQDAPRGITFVVLPNSEDGDEFREEDIRTFENHEDTSQKNRTSISLPNALFNTSGNGII